MTETPEKPSSGRPTGDATRGKRLKQNLADAIDAKNEADIAHDLQDILDDHDQGRLD